MSADTELTIPARESPPRARGANLGWRVALPLTVAAILIILAAYWRTAESIVAIWWRSETYAHGFLIVPISIVLTWLRRRELARFAPAPDWLGLALIAAAGLAWLVAWAGQVQVVQQYAMTVMIPAAVVAVAGRRVALALAFPLAFLLFGVPVGEVLIPPLMHWTAHFTVVALRLTGMPVYQQGTIFTIPDGTWSVVEGCSGLRYLIASITVGTLYAYLSYRRLWKRLLFVALSVVVPIIANGLRAYLIVMIAVLSDMKLALGIDHIIYGWVFFGLVIFLLFWLGSFWHDPVPVDRHAAGVAAAPPSPRRLSRSFAGSAVAAAVLAAAWPLWSAHLARESQAIGAPVLARPSGESGWTADTAQLTAWRPRYGGATASLFDVYRKGDQRVALYLGYYARPRRGAELVTTTNVMVVQKDPVWQKVAQSVRTRKLGKRTAEIRETHLQSAGQKLLIWDWFRIAGHDLSNPYLAKLLLAREKLFGHRTGGAAIIVATPYEDRAETAEQTLREFVGEMLPSIEATLTQVNSR
jgi:exosortase A